MKTQSAKAKGRRLQQWVRDIIRSVYGLHEDDVSSRSMGAQGEDVLLSPEARKVFPFSIECKSRSSFAIYKDFDQAVQNTPKGSRPLLVIKSDRRPPLAVLDAEWFINRMKQ